MPKFECDGCLRVIEHADPEFLCGCKDHMGWMLVGSPCWTDYHDNGIHPMTSITEEIKSVYTKHKETN